jgi:serine/threonine protein kinase
VEDRLIFSVLLPGYLSEIFSEASFRWSLRRWMEGNENKMKVRFPARIVFNAVMCGHMENINLLKQWMGIRAFEEALLDDKVYLKMHVYEVNINNRRTIVWTDLRLPILSELLKEKSGDDFEIAIRQEEEWTVDNNTVRQLLHCNRNELVEFDSEVLQYAFDTNEKESGSINSLFWVKMHGKQYVIKCNADFKVHLHERISAHILSIDPEIFARCIGYGKFKFNAWTEMFALVYESADSDFWQYLESQPYDLEIAYDVLIQSSNALRVLHNDFRMAHGDIKPDNVFLWKMHNRIVARLGDFGTSRDNATEYRAHTSTNGIGRSKGYMAPEVEEEYSDIDMQKADIYSFGKMIWAVLYCRKPSENRVEKGDMPDPQDEWSRKLYEVMIWCTKEDPKHRPSSSEVCSELSNFRAFAKARHSS